MIATLCRFECQRIVSFSLTHIQFTSLTEPIFSLIGSGGLREAAPRAMTVVPPNLAQTAGQSSVSRRSGDRHAELRLEINHLR